MPHLIIVSLLQASGKKGLATFECVLIWEHNLRLCQLSWEILLVLNRASDGLFMA